MSTLINRIRTNNGLESPVLQVIANANTSHYIPLAHAKSPNGGWEDVVITHRTNNSTTQYEFEIDTSAVDWCDRIDLQWTNDTITGLAGGTYNAWCVGAPMAQIEDIQWKENQHEIQRIDGDNMWMHTTLFNDDEDLNEWRDYALIDKSLAQRTTVAASSKDFRAPLDGFWFHGSTDRGIPVHCMQPKQMVVVKFKSDIGKAVETDHTAGTAVSLRTNVELVLRAHHLSNNEKMAHQAMFIQNTTPVQYLTTTFEKLPYESIGVADTTITVDLKSFDRAVAAIGFCIRPDLNVDQVRGVNKPYNSNLTFTDFRLYHQTNTDIVEETSYSSWLHHHNNMYSGHPRRMVMHAFSMHPQSKLNAGYTVHLAQMSNPKLIVRFPAPGVASRIDVYALEHRAVGIIGGRLKTLF